MRIFPKNTRPKLIQALEMLKEKVYRLLFKKHGNLAL